jgi:hypothetical protein
MTDDFTDFRWIVFAKTKAEIPELVIQWLTFIKTQYDKNPKALQWDRGTEFRNKTLGTYLARHGIRERLAPAGTPQLNGTAERTIGLLTETARTLRISARLDKRFWAECMRTATYLINRRPTRSQAETPFERLHKLKPDLSVLRAFGAYAYVKDKDAKKFDARASKHILIGYEERGYRLAVLSDRGSPTGEVKISRDVVFDERRIATHSATTQVPSLKFADPAGPVDPAGLNDPAGLVDPAGPLQAQVAPPGQLPSLEVSAAAPPSKAQGKTPLSLESLPPPLIDNQHRRSSRLRPSHPQVSYMTAADDLDDNISASDAIKSDSWRAAMQSEIDSLNELNTWDLVDSASVPKSKVIPSMWVFKTKRKADGSVDKLKARVVAKGFRQVPGRDFHETYAPVARPSSVRMLFALAAAYDLKLVQYDIKTAYLYADLKEEVYMAPPPFLAGSAGKVCRLRKSIYGLKQAAHEWNKLLTERLRATGLIQSAYDPCVFFRPANGGVPLAIMVIHVDDLFFASADPKLNARVHQVLETHFSMTREESPSSFLGMLVEQSPGMVKLSQPGFIDDMLKRFDLSDMRPADTPAASTRLEPRQPDEDKVDVTLTQQLVGCLQYLANGTRPDIAQAVQMIAHFTLDPGSTHLQAIKRVFRYLTGTKHLGLVYRRGPLALQLQAFADADFAGCLQTRRSTSGILINLAGAPIYFKSKRQKSVALSTAEAELVSLTECAREVKALRNLMGELGLDISAPTTVFDDNQAVVSIAHSGVDYKGRMRHLDVSKFYIQQLVVSGEIRVEFVPTTGQNADILTKPLDRLEFKRLRDRLSVA